MEQYLIIAIVAIVLFIIWIVIYDNKDVNKQISDVKEKLSKNKQINKIKSQTKNCLSSINEQLNKNEMYKEYSSKVISVCKKYKSKKIILIPICIFIGYYTLFSEKVYLRGKTAECTGFGLRYQPLICKHKGKPITGIVKVYSEDFIQDLPNPSGELYLRQLDEQRYPELNFRKNYLKYVYNVKNGMADGEYRNYWPNGNIRIIGYFKNGVLFDGDNVRYFFFFLKLTRIGHDF